MTGRQTVRRPSPASPACASSARNSAAWAAPATRVWRRPAGRSSPTSTTTRPPILTGSCTWPEAFSPRRTPGLGARISRRRTTVPSPAASPKPRAGRSMCSPQIARRTISQGATWPSWPSACRRAAASIHCFASPAAMWLILTMPEWYLVILLLVAVSALGMLWRPLLGTLPLLALSVGILVMQAGLAATRTLLPNRPASRAVRYQQQILTAVLYLLQPLARLSGRLHYGLAPWRRNGEPGGTLASMRPSVLPRRGRVAVWSKRWEHPEGKLQRIEAGIKAAGANVRRGGDYDRWDLDICVGTLGAARLLAAVEDTGSGVQLTRYRWWPRWSPAALAVTFVFGVLTAEAVEDRAFVVAAVLGAISLLLALRACIDCADAVAVIRQTVDREEP